MSDIGVMLLLGAVLLMLLGAIRFFAWLTSLQEEYGSLGGAVLAGVRYFAAPRSPRVTVNHSQIEMPEPEPARSIDVPRMNAPEPDEPRSLNPGELLLHAAEIAAINRMIEHNKTAVKPSKSSTIQAGFGISRGGSAVYQRASTIYDLLFGPPEPAVKYRSLTLEQQAFREELGLEKR